MNPTPDVLEKECKDAAYEAISAAESAAHEMSGCIERDYAKETRTALYAAIDRLAALSRPPAVEETMTAERIDRIAELVVKGMPDGISGFCKTWGWQQFARALLDICPPAIEKLLSGPPMCHGIEITTCSDIVEDRRCADCPLRTKDQQEHVSPPAEPARQVPPAEADWEEAVAINPSDIRKIPKPAAGQPSSDTLLSLINAYFDLGVAEGREGRDHDTEDGAAARKWGEIRAALRSLSAAGQQAPEGWQLVPVEPTPAMCKAALDDWYVSSDSTWQSLYAAMLSAAPKTKE